MINGIAWLGTLTSPHTTGWVWLFIMAFWVLFAHSFALGYSDIDRTIVELNVFNSIVL